MSPAFIDFFKDFERRIMNIKDYSANMKKAVMVELGEGYEVEEVTVCKNNGVKMEGLIIKKDGLSLSPTIYLKYFYENYMDGESIREGAKRFVSEYLSALPSSELDMDFYSDYEEVKKGLSFKLISGKRNQSLLKTLPHVPFLDLEMVFYYVLDMPGAPEGNILITNEHLELWGIKPDTLIKDAKANAPMKLPVMFRELYSFLKKVSNYQECDLFGLEDFPDMYVISNEEMSYGAAVMLYPGFLKEISEKLGRNLFVIPSSVHELILLPDRGYEDVSYLKDMIYEVNRTQIAPQDVLSDSLYYFDMDSEQITFA